MKPFLHTLLLFLILEIILLAPATLTHSDAAPAWLALEAVWIIAFLSVLPKPWKSPAATLLSIGMTLLALLFAVDGLMQLGFGRNVNLLLDFTLIDSAYHQLTQNLGNTFAALALGAALLGIAIFTTLLALGLSRMPSLSRQHHGGALLALLLVFPLSAISAHVSERLAMPGWQRINAHWQQIAETRQALADFQRQLGDMNTSAHRLPHLADYDIILGFIESYGVSAVFDPRYRSLVQSRLTRMEQQLHAANLHIASSRLTSPVQGGQSWLAHATLLSGLWLPTQQHYEIFLNQQPPTLIEDFKATGHLSLAIMPAITAPWPEGGLLGYDRIFGAQSIPYQGPTFNWVTMPDQYTWHFLERLRSQHEAPLFAELALISSHAPWTPILPLVEDWEELADGKVFERWAQEGPTPEQLWQDPQRVRSHYAQAIDYALAAASGYAERYIKKDVLLILVGDHQPATLITGPEASRDVPVHVISDSHELVAWFVEAGFIKGSLPPSSSAAWRMDDFRQLLQEVADSP